jgi:putative ABC transport system permease protein
MESLWQDSLLAFRMLAKRPGFTLVIALTLALGIGANTAIFSFVNALLLTPPPYRDPDRLVRLMSQRGAESGKLSLLEVEDLNRHASLFEGFASFRVSQYNVTGDGPPEAIMASINSWNLFDLLGVKPLLGRTWPQSHERQSVFNIVLSHSGVSGALAGLVPALRASKPDLNETLKEGGKSSSGGGSLRARRILAPAQAALALTLLIGAGLMLQSFLRLQRVELGFDPDGMLTMKMDPPWSKYGVVEQTAPFYRRVVEEVERIPGVETAAFNDSLPLAGQDVQEGAHKLTIEIEGQPRNEQERNPYVNPQIVNHGYFRAMKIPLLAGRSFDERDHMQSARVVIISRRLAERFWPGQDPLGRRIRLGRRSENYRLEGSTKEEPWNVIVGVSGNVRQRGVLGDAGLDVYLCDQQEFSPETYLAVRAKVEPLALAEAVKQAVWKADPEQSVFDVQTMEQRVLNTIWQQRLAGMVFALFAGLALALAAVGIYGVMSYSVSQRTREIGVRVALGARVPDILKMVLGEGLKLTLIGVAIGLLMAIAMAQLMKNLLYGVGAIDPLAFVGAPALLVATATIACLIPAWRAARTDPLTALRFE